MCGERDLYGVLQIGVAGRVAGELLCFCEFDKQGLARRRLWGDARVRW